MGSHRGATFAHCFFLYILSTYPIVSAHASSPRMFADDTSISFAAASLPELENVLNRELQNVKIWLEFNKLSLNITKTEFMVIWSCQRVNVNADESINITIIDQQVKKVNETETLGLTIEQHLTWSRHVEEKSKKIFSAIGAPG